MSRFAKLLFPFQWETVAKQGQLFGNQQAGSVAQVTNTMGFSYPGYNEMSTGVADPKVSSNEFWPFMADLWRQIQSSADYEDRTTLIISTDHGRGSGPVEWKDHGVGQPATIRLTSSSCRRPPSISDLR